MNAKAWLIARSVRTSFINLYGHMAVRRSLSYGSWARRRLIQSTTGISHYLPLQIEV